MTQDKPTKTAMMELIEDFKAIQKDGYNITPEAAIQLATELLEKEKTQIVDAYVIPHSNIRDKERAEKYYNETYKQ